MIDVCLLGTGGTMPLPDRALTSLYLSCNGHGLLIDCGEGTQVQIRKKKLSLHDIDVILFTHYHADHISGLPGLLMSMAKSERTSPVIIAGPPGLKTTVQSLCVIARDLPFDIKCIEFDKSGCNLDLIGLKITAFEAVHSVICCGYSISLERAGKFDPVKAVGLGIPKSFWKSLQSGSCIEYNGITFHPGDVLGEPRKGIKITYCTDTRPTELIRSCASDSDLFVCEGMYAEPEMQSKAEKKSHCMFAEAAMLAKTANVGCLWLTHFSPSLREPKKYSELVKNIFENTVIPNDLESITLDFEKHRHGN